ncbi:MAG TPA: hypothetical protein PK006_05860 [Saprospiraceae bacterium]|nr:hypothetical protein [Saprospiraceae bacterium]
MVETIKVKEFLRTGNFGELREIYFGMKRENLFELLGQTKWMHFTYSKSKLPSIYKYDKVEFYFEEDENGRLYGIQILPTTHRAELVDLKIDYNFIEPDLEFQSTLKFLDQESIKYELVNSELDYDGMPRIETEGKVQLIFTQDDNEINSIQKVSKFVELNSTQLKMKQINFSIPDAEYQKLKEQAINTRKSIQNICKEIILDKLNKN